MVIPGDVTNAASVKANVQKVLNAYGKIDILVSSAAVLGGKGGSTITCRSSSARCASF